MELLWYDIRTLDTDTMAHTVGSVRMSYQRSSMFPSPPDHSFLS